MSEPEAPIRLPRVAILGAGAMGGAILAGLRAPGVDVDGIAATALEGWRADELVADGVEAYATENDPEANHKAVAGAGLVVVAVKPNMVADLLADVAPALDPTAVVVSIAAGVTTAAIEAHVSVPVIRVMPNTPAQIGRGMTAIAAGSRAGERELALAQTLFRTVGEVIVVPEEKINAVTAISGSGPAYVFHAIENWIAAAEGLGFTPEEARLLVAQTFLGSSELLMTSGEAPEELRRRVTSPGGTTAAAVAVLEEGGLADLYARAAAAAVTRAEELGS